MHCGLLKTHCLKKSLSGMLALQLREPWLTLYRAWPVLQALHLLDVTKRPA